MGVELSDEIPLKSHFRQVRGPADEVSQNAVCREDAKRHFSVPCSEFLPRKHRACHCLSRSIQLRSIQLVSPNRISKVSLIRLSKLGSSGTSAPSARSPVRISLASGASKPGRAHFRPCERKRRPQNAFHCDREGITIKRIPWLDFSNRTWRTYTYPLSEVSAIRFAVIASAKGRAVSSEAQAARA